MFMDIYIQRKIKIAKEVLISGLQIWRHLGFQKLACGPTNIKNEKIEQI